MFSRRRSFCTATGSRTIARTALTTARSSCVVVCVVSLAASIAGARRTFRCSRRIGDLHRILGPFLVRRSRTADRRVPTGTSGSPSRTTMRSGGSSSGWLGHHVSTADPAYKEPRGIAMGPDGAVWFTETGSHTGPPRRNDVSSSGVSHRVPAPSQQSPIRRSQQDRTGTSGTPGAAPHGRSAAPPLRVPSRRSPNCAPQRPPEHRRRARRSAVVHGRRDRQRREPALNWPMTTTGSLSEYVLPTPVGDYSGAGDITVGADGNLWFTWGDVGCR